MLQPVAQGLPIIIGDDHIACNYRNWEAKLGHQGPIGSRVFSCLPALWLEDVGDKNRHYAQA